MRLFLLFIMGCILVGCSKKDTPKQPEAALLAFPLENSECTTGQDLNATTSRVEFKWLSANHTETYELRVTNINTGNTQTISTKALSAKLPLTKGVPFSWLVNSKNSQVSQAVPSATWRFYNAGYQTSHPPFPPIIIAPKLAEYVFKDINNEITLDWSGADVDNDIIGYDIYFSTDTPPVTLTASTSAGTTAFKVSVSSNTAYYWRVVVKDGEGNSSDSGIFNFTVL
ncbi:MAG: hypothetical protein MUO53_13860 [Maribacter sp.]|nr:hypothetical protein [Maribacter sp.]